MLNLSTRTFNAVSDHHICKLINFIVFFFNLQRKTPKG